MVLYVPKTPDRQFQDSADYFHNRSAYCVLSTPVPDPFVAFEMAMAARFPRGTFLPGVRAVTLAENACRRMSNIDFAADQITQAIASRNDTRRAWALNPLMVSHFSACKSLLDAVAIALSDVYELRLSNKEQDFGKASIWRKLATKQPAVHVRYEPFRPWMSNEVIKWRDAAVHRSAPLVIPTMARSADGVIDADTMAFKVPLDPDIDNAKLWNSDLGTIPSGAPLHYHESWRDQFISLCSEACRDIATIL